MPALAKLKLVFGLELTAGGVIGPGESERFHVEVPGTEGLRGAWPRASGCALSIPRTMFKLLAEEGELADWKDAFYYGHLKVEGTPRPAAARQGDRQGAERGGRLARARGRLRSCSHRPGRRRATRSTWPASPDPVQAQEPRAARLAFRARSRRLDRRRRRPAPGPRSARCCAPG